MDIHSRIYGALRAGLPGLAIALTATLFAVTTTSAQQLNHQPKDAYANSGQWQTQQPPLIRQLDSRPAQAGSFTPAPSRQAPAGQVGQPFVSSYQNQTYASPNDAARSGTIENSSTREVDSSAWRVPSPSNETAAQIPDSGSAYPANPGFQTMSAGSNSSNQYGPGLRPPAGGPSPSYEHQPRNERAQTGQVQHVSFESASPATYIEQGQELEQSGQWGEALALYQQGIKEFPENARLGQRRSLARIHFDLDRRYSDTSFLKTISETSGTKALNVYAEVLLRIQSYYVDEPKWSQMAGFGLTSLEVALETPEFRRRNLPGISDAQIERAIELTRQQLRDYPADTRNDAYVIAGTAAKILDSEIGLSPQATVYEFVCGAISALDPYSAFMSSNQYNETMSQIEGNFVGLGVELRTHQDHLEIVSVIKGGSASGGGIQEGDRIIAVDEMAVTKVGSERAADMLRGIEGSFVSLSIDRGGIPEVARLERKRVDIPSVDRVRIIDAETGVGYIQLTNFQKTTARDFDAALWQLQRQGMRSLIVDVRGNPGGLLSASVEVADRFINSGVIVSTRGRNPLEDYVHRAESQGTWNLPLVVLIDGNSASASEIFAAAIRDHDAGKIVGEQSYGKGSVQGIFPLNVSGGGVRLTTAKFYSPTGQPISEVGVQADYLVSELARPDPQGNRSDEDAGLRIGIQVARQLMAAPSAGLQSVAAGR